MVKRVEQRIIIPGSQVTISMTKEEADIRSRIAQLFDGVEFIIRESNDPDLSAYAAVVKGRVIGTTIVQSQEVLQQYAEMVKRDLATLESAKKPS